MNLTPDTDIVLLVDDTPNNLEVLSEALADAGIEVAISKSGESALQILEYTPIGLILLDVMMPGLSGFETCKRLKEDPSTCDIPVIFMTALSDTLDKVKGLNLGAVDYITKPFQKEEVIARVHTQLKIRHLMKTLESQNHQLKAFNEQLELKVAERTVELSQSLQNLEQAQLQLIQQEKMSALGNMMAGIAHEINNPVGFIKGNIQPASDYVSDLLELIDLYQKKLPDPDDDLLDKIEEIDLEYLQEDLPKLLNSMRLGVERIRDISTSLRTFSRVDKADKVPCNIHEGLDSTIMILRHRLKGNSQRPEIEVVKDYGSISDILCFPSQLNQVFMNILANAIDALEDANQGKSFSDIQANPNQITIHTKLLKEANQVEIRIADNGVGIPEDVQAKVFDHLFTTKAVGKGTGLGMAIAHQIIVEKHGGLLTVDSVPQEGTEFKICLPL
jgi:signal transduction histidine kinase